MEKGLCYASMGVAGLLFLMFLLDLLGIALPFYGVSATVDVIGILISGLVFYLAYDAFRDLK